MCLIAIFVIYLTWHQAFFYFFRWAELEKRAFFFSSTPPPPKKKDNIQQIQGVAERQVNHSLPGIMDCLGRVVCPRVGNWDVTCACRLQGEGSRTVQFSKLPCHLKPSISCLTLWGKHAVFGYFFLSFSIPWRPWESKRQNWSSTLAIWE